MSRSLTRDEALAFQARWCAVNAHRQGELRQTTLDEKLRQLDMLMRSVDAMGWRAVLAEDDRREHELWNELRERLHG